MIEQGGVTGWNEIQAMETKWAKTGSGGRRFGMQVATGNETGNTAMEAEADVDRQVMRRDGQRREGFGDRLEGDGQARAERGRKVRWKRGLKTGR